MPQLLFDVRQFLWVWAVFVVVFFSLSDSKLIPYVLPALPALALMVAASPAATLRREFWLAAAGTLLAGTALAAAGVLGPRYLGGSERDRVFALLAQPLLEIGVAARPRRGLGLGAPRPGCHPLGHALGVGLVPRRAARDARRRRWSRPSIRARDWRAPRSRPRAPHCTASAPTTRPCRSTGGVPSRSPPIAVNSISACDSTPPRGIPTVANFLDTWRRAPSAYAVMDSSLYKDLERQGVPMREIDRDLRHVLVARP